MCRVRRLHESRAGLLQRSTRETFHKHSVKRPGRGGGGGISAVRPAPQGNRAREKVPLSGPLKERGIC